MKIRTQFIITMSLFGLLLIATSGSLAITLQQIERLRRQEQVAQNIVQNARDLSYLSNDYLLYHESQQRSRWEAKFNSLTENLNDLAPDNPEQQVLVNQIEGNQQRLRAVFTDIASTLEDPSQDPATITDLTFIQISWSRMEVQNQGIVFDASLLAQKYRDQADRLYQANLVLIFVLVGIFGIYIIINYFIVYRQTLRSLATLQAGARVIGSGDLTYTLDATRTDEIGDLSRAFNSMTANLQAITASKIDLEREIAERKQAELALAQANSTLQIYTDKLKRSNQALQDFAFVASHDLREPLRKVRVFGDRLLSDRGQRLDETGRGYIERMVSSAVRMETMLDGLLAYSRVSTQTQLFAKVDLGQIAKEIISDLEIRIGQTSGRVEIGDLPVIEADPVQMRQIFQNLVGNGLKFHQPDLAPIVKVYVKKPGEGEKASESWDSDPLTPGLIEIVVEDNGIGFEMKHAGQLFKPFHRLVDKRTYEGTGMGLAICQRIAERHGGSITASSSPNQGSTFIVALPVRQMRG